MDTEQFLQNASSKTKQIGNNKYQEQINTLNTKILELLSNIETKNQELDLFKRNFSDMQLQFQEKNIQILESSNQISKLEVENQAFNNNIFNLNNTILSLSNNIENNIQKNQNEKDQYINSLNQVTHNKNDLQTRFDDIKIKYKQTLSQLDIKIYELENLSKDHTINIREFNLEKQLSKSTNKELDSIKEELSVAHNQTKLLQITLEEKEKSLIHIDSQLKDVMTRMENNIFKFKISEPIVHEIKSDSTDTVDTMKISRGLKVSKR